MPGIYASFGTSMLVLLSQTMKPLRAKMSPKKREEYFQQKEELRIAELQKRREDRLKAQQKYVETQPFT